MSGSQQLLLGETGGGGDSGPVYIEDVFSTYLYTGNGSSITITNGIDLSGKGGLVWQKSRQDVGFNHVLFDTVTGVNKNLWSNATNQQTTVTGNSVLSNGFVTGINAGYTNENNYSFVSWTFREQAKFFDIVTYTGTGTTAQNINHNLGSVPGCIIIKRTDSTGDWGVVHRSTNAYANYGFTGGKLNTTGVVGQSVAEDTGIYYDNSTYFQVDEGSAYFNPNASGGTYVAYLFAHNAGGFGLTGTDNVISCGSYTGNGSTSGNPVTLGFEPQWVMIKQTNASGNNWVIVDVMRGIPTGSDDSLLAANTSGAETYNDRLSVTSTGFSLNSLGGDTNANGSTYIYIAIRRGPMKVPTSGTSVFAVSQAVEPQSSALFAAGFSDMVMHSPRVSDGGAGNLVTDRLRGDGRILVTQSENAENNQSGFPYTKFDSNAGAYIPAGGYYNNSGGGSSPYVMSAFRRAPQFFDEVCYTGNSAIRTLSHNLGIAPELMIVKKRSSSSTSNWVVYPGPLANNDYYLFINTDVPVTTASVLWNSTAPTSTVFTLGASINANDNGETYVNYLFATCAGVSKVGSYTGTGTTQTINCGFTGGARWIMIKRTDATGDWFYWNSASGIVAGNDPYLLLNTTSAQVTGTDYVDTAASGFEISSTAPAAINANGGTFIFLAIA